MWHVHNFAILSNDTFDYIKMENILTRLVQIGIRATMWTGYNANSFPLWILLYNRYFVGNHHFAITAICQKWTQTTLPIITPD